MAERKSNNLKGIVISAVISATITALGAVLAAKYSETTIINQLFLPANQKSIKKVSSDFEALLEKKEHDVVELQNKLISLNEIINKNRINAERKITELEKTNIALQQKINEKGVVINEIKSTSGQFIQKLNDVTYTLVKAERNGNETLFWFKAFNDGAEKSTGLYFTCSLIDNDGTSHRQSARIAGGRRGGLDSLGFKIPYAVPTRFGLAFKTLSPKMTTVPFLEVVLRGQGKLEFRQIPIPYDYIES